MSTYLDLNKDLTPQQIALKEQVHRFADEVLRPAAVKLDAIADPEEAIKPDSVLWKTLRTAYELGYHAQGLPEALGGANLSPLERHIVNEEMGWGSADFSIALGVAAFPFAMAAMSGFLPQTAAPGRPPATIFASVVRSGVTPKYCCAPPGA